jgi:hypothetical protein
MMIHFRFVPEGDITGSLPADAAMENKAACGREAELRERRFDVAE